MKNPGLAPSSKLFALFLLAWPLVGASSAEVPRAEGQGVTLTATPLTSGQKTAFFTARGFTTEQIAPYAQACGFSFSFENREHPALTFRLAEWTAEIDGRVIRFAPLAGWESEWQRQGIGQPARIAFRWAQFPAEHEFARGDWIMGMTNLMVPPGGPFRLVARFNAGGKTLELPIDNLVCAPLD